MALRVPVPQRVTVIRIVALSVSLTAAIGAFGLFLQVAATTGLDWLDGVRAGLILIATFWLAWGAVLALLGLCCSQARRPILTAPVRGRTVILVPIYNEDPVVTFARIAAMTGELRDHALTASVHIAILSDTTDKVIAARERFWFLRLLTETDGNGWIFYRRRGGNRGRKAGNVADFIRRSGAAYDYALILDADSLMTGNTIVQMIRRMDADPRLGLLQSPPTIIRARSRFGRAMQFSAAFHGPIYGRGLAMMQGQTGPFWGHNAIVRISAFANSCGLPELSGPAPFGGHVLSHDYVEAALLARAGWTVRLDTDLDGSFEEAPDNMIAFAKRDRRWCQGNLQHARILPASSLRLWSRFVFVQGILAYLAPVFWVVFLLASIAAPVLTPAITAEPNYFPQANWPFPVLPADQASQAIGLALGVFGLLIVPKLAIALDAGLRGRAGQGFGGAGRAFASTLGELILSAITAPIFLMFQTRAVLQVLSGRDGGWPAQNRGDGQLTITDAWDASYWIVVTGLIGMGLAQLLSPDLLPWLVPVTGPMLLAPLVIWATSRPAQGRLFQTPSEVTPPPVMQRHDQILARWQGSVNVAQDDKDGSAVTNV